MTATRKSGAPAAARPSTYLMAASLLLLVSAALGLAGSDGAAPDEEALLRRGWEPADRAECPTLRAGAYYELANEERSAELYVREAGGVLTSRLPLPEAPYECREIPEPHFVEEIR